MSKITVCFQWDVLEKIGGLDGDLLVIPYEAMGAGNFLNTAMTTKAIKQGVTKKETTEEKDPNDKK